MNNVTDTKSLVEFYHLPGVGTKETATILATGTDESCNELYNSLRKANLATGDDHGYRYNILPTTDAAKLVVDTNVEYNRALKAWRNKVFNEPAA